MNEEIEIYAAGKMKSLLTFCGITKTSGEPLYAPLEFATGEFSFRPTDDR